MTVETASNIRIQRSASWAIVSPSRHERAQLLDRVEADLEVARPENVSPTSKASPWRLKCAVVVGREVGSRVNLPVSRPEASGTRTITPTSRAFACSKNSSAGRWRKMLKMIWTVATPGYSIAFSASSTFSTLTP